MKNPIPLIKALAKPDQAMVTEAVNDWLDDHPEATTTVQDGSITKAKLNTALQTAIDAKATSDALSAARGTMLISTGFTYTKSTGYIEENGNINPTDQHGVLYTSLIPVYLGERLSFELKHSANRSNWCAYALYNSAQKFIRRYAFISNVSASYVSSEIVISDKDVSYIAFTWRNFTDGVETIALSDISAMLKAVAAPPQRSFVKGVSHSGYSKYAPSNNLLAYQQSALMGFRYAETDVRFTSDGVPVCLHDASINSVARNADGTQLSTTVNIHDITYEETLTYDFGLVKGQEYAGTKISTLEEVLLLCRAVGLHLYIELKYDAAYTEAQIKGLVTLVTKLGMRKYVSWISTNVTYLGYIHAADANARLGYVADTLTEERITSMTALRDANEVFVTQSYSYVTDDTLALCIDAGLPLEVYTVNTEAGILAIDPYVTGIASDYFDASKVLSANALA